MARSSCALASLRAALLLAPFALALPASLARAQCTTDADCAAGEVCASLDKPTIDCPPGETCPTPPDEQPITEGECVGAPCTDDADCPDGMGCELGGHQSSPGSSGCIGGDGGCPEPEPASEPEGQCEPQPIACKSDGDCPTGLTCVEEDHGDSAVACTSRDDGGMVCEEPPAPQPTTRACGLAWVECKDDSDCTQDGYVCTVVETKTSCDAVPCSADGVCPEPTPEDCLPVEHRMCFPGRTDCTDDSECADGWTCYALPDDLREDAPVGWEGATDVCFPEGIALAIDDKIALADVASSGNSGDSAGDGKGTAVDEDPAMHTASPSAEDADSDADAKSSDDGGCSVALVSGRGPGAGSLGLLLLSALGLARRRRAQPARA